MKASPALHFTALLMATLAGAPALANGPALVVDAHTGRVLHAERATDPWYPASITKLMTTYVALSLVREGRASLDQLLTVSEGAASLPPSKMAFKPGTQIRLDNALKIIMVKSANDVSATIAENLGGSIEGFADLMNAYAAHLGMRESRFVNPHGLPDERQQTSARDMAILARALFRTFPEQEDLFDIGAIQFGRRIMKNHNGLIGRYPGADGMKTGFICASGFNVVASAKRDGRRLITVVLGSSSANERTLKAADLFDRGFAAGGAAFGAPTLEALQMSAQSMPPNMRPVICDRRGPMPGEDDSGTVEANAAGGPNLLSSPGVLSFAGGMAQPPRTLLGPRAPVQPVQVWIGPNPPTEAELAAQAAQEAAEEKERIAKQKAAQEKRLAARKAKADEKTETAEKKLTVPRAIVEEGKNGRATLSLKPVANDKKAKAAAETRTAVPAAKSAPAPKSNAPLKISPPVKPKSAAADRTDPTAKPTAKN
jgi:D-alanyl-D-alanine carboxypeptidase